MRYVVVNETGEQTSAVAFADADAAKAFAIPLLDAQLVAVDVRKEYPADLSVVSLEELGDYVGSVLILEEGAGGVWTGFSSADRCLIGGPYPDEDGTEFYGNGDPNVYSTVGQPDGVAVAGVEMPAWWASIGFPSGCEDDDKDDEDDD